MCQILWHENKQTNKKKLKNHSILHCPWSQNSQLWFLRRKYFAVIWRQTSSQYNVFAFGLYWVWHIKQRKYLCVKEWLYCIHLQMFLRGTSLINMSVRECSAPERATFWKHNHHSCTTFLSIRFNVFIHPLMEAIEENGEEYLRGSNMFHRVFSTSCVTGEIITINHIMHSCTCIEIKSLFWPFHNHPINWLQYYHCSICICMVKLWEKYKCRMCVCVRAGEGLLQSCLILEDEVTPVVKIFLKSSQSSLLCSEQTHKHTQTPVLFTKHTHADIT